MMAWAKKILWILVIGFALFYLITQPEAAAQAVRTFFGAFGSVYRFFAELARG